MTPSRLAVQNFANVTLRRRNAFLLLQNVYYQRLLAAQQKREIDLFNQSSRRTLKIVEMSTSEICASEFADWTLFDADLGNGDFVEECMALFSVWCADLEEDWSDVETMTSEECASCGVMRFYAPDADADAVRCTCEEASSAFTDSDVSSSSGVSQSALDVPWDLNRVRILANGRVQYVSSMFGKGCDFSDSEACCAEQVNSATRRLEFDDDDLDCSSSEESLAMTSFSDKISSSSSEESIAEDSLPLRFARMKINESISSCSGEIENALGVPWDLNRVRKLANGRVQYVSTMFDESCDFSDSEESVLLRAPSEEILASYRLSRSDEQLELSMQLFAAWTEEKEEEKAPIRIYGGMSTGACECLARLWQARRAKSSEELEQSMSLFAAWTEEKDEGIAELDTHDSLLMAALLSTMEESSAASVDLRAASCPDLLMDAARPSRWEDYIYTYPTSESDATPVTSSISQYPMNIETLSARSSVSTSSLFKDPTSASSDASSLSSSDSQMSHTSSVISSDSIFLETMSSRSYFSSSSSSILKDPASDASYCALCCVPVPFCPHVNRGSTIEEDDWDLDAFSDLDEGYATDEDSDPAVPRKTTVVASTQTEETDKASVARMLADCDSILVTVMEMKKLMEMQ